MRMLVAAAALAAVFFASPVPADSRLEELEETAFKQATLLAERSIVRIETVGGLDRVGQVLTGTGPTTGVVVGRDGLVITSSFHFISRPAGILVTLPDGQRLPAQVIAADKLRMLTLLKVELPAGSPPLTPLAPVPRQSLRVGQWSIALGRTYDAGVPNLSVGILSATNRVWGRAVQTDAKISPANYGGPLIDLNGRGIGILVPLSPEKTDETAGVEWYDGGIGFAIPLEDVYAALPRLQSGETLHPGLLGISFREQGLLAGAAEIDRVRPDSPAASAGLKPGDVILEADGQPIARVPQLQHVLGRKYAGDAVALAVRRGSETLRVEAKLAAELQAYESGYLGVLPMRLKRGAAGTSQGVELRAVLPESPAEKAGFKRSDVITAVSGSPVNDAAAMLDAISRVRPGETVELRYQREGQEQSATVKLAAIGGTIPAELPAVNLPAPETPLLESVRVGRFSDTLAGVEERKYWAYVPAQYNPEYEYGLLVWLHPAGDTLEASIRTRWQQHCDRRGLILIAPKASDLGGWTPGEAAFVKDLVEDFRKNYSIDPRRIAVHGHSEGGRFAWVNAFRERDLFRGVCASSAAIPVPPPDNDPAYRQQILMVNAAEDPLRSALETTIAILTAMRFPVQVIAVDGNGRHPPAAETVDEIARWFDLLDRI